MVQSYTEGQKGRSQESDVTLVSPWQPESGGRSICASLSLPVRCTRTRTLTHTHTHTHTHSHTRTNTQVHWFPPQHISLFLFLSSTIFIFNNHLPLDEPKQATKKRKMITSRKYKTISFSLSFFLFLSLNRNKWSIQLTGGGERKKRSRNNWRK